jgi:hypothetical protein
MKNFGFYKPNFFCLENTTLVSRNRNFLKFELEKFRFLRTEIFIKGKIGFFGGIKETRGAGREIV